MAGNPPHPIPRLDFIAQEATYRGGGPGAEHPDSAYCSTYRHPRPAPLDLHFHAGMEFGIVLEGEEEVHVGDTVFRCGPGGTWLCGMWEQHSWRVNVAGTVNVVIIFAPLFLGEEALGDPLYLGLFQAAPECRPQVKDPELRARLLALGEGMKREIQERRPRWEKIVRIDLLRALNELARAAEVPFWEQPTMPPTYRSAAVRVMPALELVHRSQDRRVSVAEAAVACSVSVSRFHHLFQQAMGVSFGQFSMRARLTAVADRLIYTDDSLGAIALEAGFVDLSHFCRAFRKHYGYTPQQYRNLR